VYLEKATRNRTTDATSQNLFSSRSHAIITFFITCAAEIPGVGGETGKTYTRTKSKLNLVDLAGSERQKADSKAVAKETRAINRSLSVLSNVISVLSQMSVNGRTAHVPYRDSKLTQLLKDSLGGNTNTLMIACVNAALANVSETLSTLRYAHRAKAIVNEVTVNEGGSKDDIIHNLRKENARLMVLLSSQQEQGLVGSEQSRLAKVVMHSEDVVAQNEALEANRVELEAQNGGLIAQNGDLEAQHGELQAQNAALKAQNEAWQSEAMEAQNAAWELEVKGLRQAMQDKAVATQKEAAMLQSALVEERRLAAHHKETIMVMQEMSLETAARVGASSPIVEERRLTTHLKKNIMGMHEMTAACDGTRPGELLDAVASADEQVSGSPRMQFVGHSNCYSLTP
jgi:hypothetical protein